MLRNELLIYFPQKEFYCQEDIKGYVELRNPAPMTIYEVNIQFLGCEWAELNNKKEGNVFIKHEAILTGDGSRDRGKDFFGYKVKQTTVVPAGSHYYEFTIKLPEACPPSYQCGFGKIVYELRATAVSGIKGVQDLVSCATVPVGGSLFDLNFLGNNSVPTTIKDTKAFLLFGNVDYIINLDSKVFYSGDVIRAKGDFQNKSSKVIKPLVARLVQRIELHSYGKLQKVDEVILASQVLGSLEAKQNKNFAIELQLPTTAPESVFKKDIDKKKACGKIIQIAYQIVIHGEVSMAVDLHNDIPISVIRKERQQFLMAKHGIAQPPPQAPQQPQQQFQQMPQQPQFVQPQMVPQQQQQYVYQQPQQQMAPQQPQQPQMAPQYQDPAAVAPQDPNSLYPSLYPSSAPQQNYYPVQDPMQQPQQQGVAKKVPPPAPAALLMQHQLQQVQQPQPQYVQQPQFQQAQPPQQQAYVPQQQQMPPQFQGMAPMAPQGMTAHSSASQQSEIYDEFFTEQ